MDSGNNLSRKKHHGFLVQVIKYYPIIINIFIILNTLEPIWDIECIGYLYPIIGHSVIFDMIMFSLSILFQFCWWHRILVISLIANAMLIFLDITVLAKLGLKEPIVLSTIIWGIGIVASVIARFKCKDNLCSHDNKKP